MLQKSVLSRAVYIRAAQLNQPSGQVSKTLSPLGLPLVYLRPSLFGYARKARLYYVSVFYLQAYLGIP
jgi:hypothetical protein